MLGDILRFYEYDSLGRSKEKFADFLSPLVESCLPEDVLRAWERHRACSILKNDAELPENSQRSLENLGIFEAGSPWMKELRDKNIVITDTEDSVRPIELLIGADIATTILTGRQENLSCGILATETLLVWTVLGKPSLDEDTENFSM
ncbi:hypothetical protein AVEN_147820-1 [Araneus ventricosus]|uniref:Peptidase aspartic putative domain-containing protein n=1 Tax=Araneus ventricosus TaxID=182803 RepID=A0A4Y2CUC8_ARAVE|nr:hypothetical protein AVEN_147820-1 [Araneus ventricosus]